MRLLPRSAPARTALATGTTALAVLLVGTTAAVAAPAATPHQAAGADAGTSSVTSAPPPGCTDELVTFGRDGTVGDDRAVAITAQALQRGVDGWQRLTWQAGSGTTLTLVVATGEDGEVRELPPTTTGTVENVRTLTFCGSRDTSGEITAEPEPPAPTVEPEPPAPTTEPPSGATEVDGEQEQPQRDAAQQAGDDDPGRTDAAGVTGAAGAAGVADVASVRPGTSERSGRQQAGTVEPGVGVSRTPAATPGARQAATHPLGPADEHRAAAEGLPTTGTPVATASATAPVTPVTAARTSEVLHAELVAATGRGRGWLTPLLLSLLAIAGTGAAIAAARRRTGRAQRSAGRAPQSHLEAGR